VHGWIDGTGRSLGFRPPLIAWCGVVRTQTFLDRIAVAGFARIQGASPWGSPNLYGLFIAGRGNTARTLTAKRALNLAISLVRVANAIFERR
jgi:hypothetical protein